MNEWIERKKEIEINRYGSVERGFTPERADIAIVALKKLLFYTPGLTLGSSAEKKLS